MRAVLRVAVLAPGTAALLAVSVSAAAAPVICEPVASLEFAAEAGAHPVQGSGTWVAPEAEVRVWEYDNVVKVDAEVDGGRNFIRLEFSGADGAPLTRRTYRDVRHLGSPGAPGILVVSNGLGCGDDYADVRVKRIRRDSTGALIRLDLTFEHHCGSPTAPALRGEVRYVA